MIAAMSPVLSVVPAHAGGVDLSIKNTFQTVLTMVPAHAGGVDLSGGFKHFVVESVELALWSPPMRAGWI